LKNYLLVGWLVGWLAGCLAGFNTKAIYILKPLTILFFSCLVAWQTLCYLAGFNTKAIYILKPLDLINNIFLKRRKRPKPKNLISK